MSDLESKALNLFNRIPLAERDAYCRWRDRMCFRLQKRMSIDEMFSEAPTSWILCMRATLDVLLSERGAGIERLINDDC